MRMVVLAAGLVVFAAIVWAVRFHFASRRLPWRFVLVSIASAISIGVFVDQLWRKPKDPLALACALALILIAGALFSWTVAASRKAALKLIYDADSPVAVLREGPYRFVRHPFYLSYILFWAGCGVATLHAYNIAFAALLVPVLVQAAVEEERGFARSERAADYAAYRRQAGLLWPRLGGG